MHSWLRTTAKKKKKEKRNTAGDDEDPPVLTIYEKCEGKNGQCTLCPNRYNYSKRMWLYQTFTYMPFKTEFPLESNTGFDVENDHHVICVLPNEEQDLLNT